jgi:hypothetical protein
MPSPPACTSASRRPPALPQHKKDKHKKEKSSKKHKKDKRSKEDKAEEEGGKAAVAGAAEPMSEGSDGGSPARSEGDDAGRLREELKRKLSKQRSEGEVQAQE